MSTDVSNATARQSGGTSARLIYTGVFIEKKAQLRPSSVASDYLDECNAPADDCSTPNDCDCDCNPY